MTDPIFAAIDAHRFADTRWEQCNEEAKGIAPSANDNATNEFDRKAALAEQLWEAASAAAQQLFMVTPTTVSGSIALLKYITEREAGGDELLMFDNLPGPHRKSSVALCHRLIEALERA